MYELEILEAIAERLAARGIGEWDTDANYAASGPLAAIYVRMVPETARPLITLSPYPVTVALSPNDSILGLQVRTRTPGRDPRTTDQLDGAVLGVLHGLRNVELGGHRVTKILFQSGDSMGQDGSGRWSRSSNYYITGPRWEGEPWLTR